jgi:hypothetical protein
MGMVIVKVVRRDGTEAKLNRPALLTSVQRELNDARDTLDRQGRAELDEPSPEDDGRE